ncbi:coiled-coil domain-containing protein 92 [Alosa alosa]|uniref:coiled-coil domain-containing protein 92 n=1 Tax=Alosa alosa TaxID=278164 RepID=UPI00201522FC|nr:coiled-coil domain-containing protein 92 [Alosa alosa]
MASVSVTLENQLHSAQKNLLFLQQDHANTLKGLHAEIRRLQQHCTDLTYELTVKSSDPTDSSEARCRALHERCEELEEQLREKEEENAELLRDLEQKTAMISVLEGTLREREKKYLDELKLKSQRLAALSGELEQRASTIAYLTSQLHATKRRLLAGGGSSADAVAAATPPAGGGASGASPAPSPSSSSPAYRPAPPAQPQPQDTPTRRRMRKSLSQPLHAEWAELYRQGAGPEGRRLILREALEAMPDPTPFLQPRDPSHAATPAPHHPPQPLHKSRPAVIPPIVAASERNDLSGAESGSPTPTGTPTRLPAVPSASSFSPRGSPARHQRAHGGAGTHVGVAHRIPHSPQPGSPSGTAPQGIAPQAQPHPPSRPIHAELQTLAVDQVNGGAKVVSQADRTEGIA